MTTPAIEYRGPRFHGPNFAAWNRSLSNALHVQEVADWHFASPAEPPHPLDRPGHYVLLRPNYAVVPIIGVEENDEALQILLQDQMVQTPALVQAARASMDFNTFSTLDPRSDEGAISRLTTTNSAEAVSKAMALYRSDRKEWAKCRSKAVGILRRSVDDKVATKLKLDEHQDAATAYLAARNYFESYLKQYSDMLIEELRNVMPFKGEKVEQFAERVRDMSETLQYLNQGHGNESEQVRLLLRGMEGRYEVLVEMLRGTQGCTMDQAVLALRQREAKANDKARTVPPPVAKPTSIGQPDPPKDGAKALAALTKQKAKQQQQQQGGKGNQDSSKQKLCYNCHQPGHFRWNCPELKDRKSEVGGVEKAFGKKASLKVSGDTTESAFIVQGPHPKQTEHAEQMEHATQTEPTEHLGAPDFISLCEDTDEEEPDEMLSGFGNIDSDSDSDSDKASDVSDVPTLESVEVSDCDSDAKMDDTSNADRESHVDISELPILEKIDSDSEDAGSDFGKMARWKAWRKMVLRLGRIKFILLRSSRIRTLPRKARVRLRDRTSGSLIRAAART